MTGSGRSAKDDTPGGEVRVGISGWRYGGWRKVFYPEGLVQRRELEYASRKVRTIEINGSFYSLQRPASFRAWYAETPRDFVFAVKGSRFITHMKKLEDVEVPLANFFASGVLCLGEKLGPLLWQLPRQLHFDRDRLAAFLELLPKTTSEAESLAARCDRRVEGRCALAAPVSKPLRHALEVRHESYMTADLVDLLRQHGVGLVFADTAGLWPYTEDVTSDFVYIRLHGAEELYVSGYRDDQLDWWAARIRAWRRGGEPPDARHVAPTAPVGERSRDVYVYFDNDGKVRAPFDAMRLAERLQAAP